MKTPSYEATTFLPLVSDVDIERRVADLIGRANTRQLWLMFLDDVNLQLPLLIPVDGLPTEPADEQTALIIARIRELMDEIGAASVVFVWERYGAPSLTAQDAAWIRSLRAACDACSVVVRAILLSHRMGVRRISDDDYASSARE